VILARKITITPGKRLLVKYMASFLAGGGVELVDEPAGCGEVTRGGCLFA
jgi:hypothetical protein